jgi:DNA-binding SARP family transcriptional activator
VHPDHRRRQREITREAIATLRWPERTDDRARQALKQTLHELRRTLGDDLVDGQGDRLRINPSVSIDVEGFEEVIGKNECDRALTLYRGGLLDHFFLLKLISSRRG